MVSIFNRREKLSGSYFNINRRNNMKKTISIIIILMSFLSLTNAFSEGRKHKNEREMIYLNDSQNYRCASRTQNN